MLLWLVLVAADPGAGLDLPPAEDPVGRLIATVVAIAVPVSAVAVARIQAKKSPINGPAPIPATDSPTPRLDLGGEYLAEFVQHLKNSDAATNAKYDDLHQKYLELLEKYATLSARYEAMSDDLRDATAKVSFLEGQLRGRNG